MYWDAKLVKPLPDYRIYVELENGQKGVFDLKPYLDSGVFRELKDVHYFNQVDFFWCCDLAKRTRYCPGNSIS